MRFRPIRLEKLSLLGGTPAKRTSEIYELGFHGRDVFVLH
jgi:hypothetical protein